MSVKRDATKLNAIEFDFVILFGCETNRDQRVNGSRLLNCLQCHFKRMFDVQRSLAPYGKLYRDISLFFSEIDTTERKIDGMKQKRRKSITNDITEMHLVTEQYGVFVYVCVGLFAFIDSISKIEGIMKVDKYECNTFFM